MKINNKVFLDYLFSWRRFHSGVNTLFRVIKAPNETIKPDAVVLTSAVKSWSIPMRNLMKVNSFVFIVLFFNYKNKIYVYMHLYDNFNSYRNLIYQPHKSLA